ncbi:MAG: YHS domain-containing protein [Hyphomonadaceae bacterium]|nr:YHS domain-containing protein [Hyphomonadaceae bacterium]
MRDGSENAQRMLTVRDPVCGMTPTPDTPHRLLYDGDEVLFCSAGCKAKFAANPARYVSHGAHADCKRDHGGALLAP